jgi:aminoglycoside phosphotransferase (APT) family kinase protein
MLPGLETEVLERSLAAAQGSRVRLLDAVALGTGSRAAAWRIDVESGGESASYLLRYGEGCSPTEVTALRAMEEHPIPTPRVVLWDEGGAVAGTRVFVSEWIDGEPLLPAMTAGENWAVDLYLETVCGLQAITAADLPQGAAEALGAGETIRDVIEEAYGRLEAPEPLHDAAYRRLIATQPEVPGTQFSNGDLWPENLLVKGRELVGVVDWQHAGWSDPIFEFLLPFFLVPELRSRGIEARYCERKGFDPGVLHWYHGVEFFDSLAWVLKTGEPYEMHTAESLTCDLQRWLESP